MKKESEPVNAEVALIRQSVRRIKWHYYISALLMALFGVLVSRGIIPHHNIFPEGKDIMAQTIFMIIVLLCIPFLLKWFNTRTGKLKQLDTLEARLEGYEKAYLIRVYLFDAMALLALLFAILSDMKQVVMFFMMIFLFYFFFLPGFKPLIRDLDLNEDGSFYRPDAGYDVNDTRVDESESDGSDGNPDEEDDGFIPKNPKRDATRVSHPM